MATLQGFLLDVEYFFPELLDTKSYKQVKITRFMQLRKTHTSKVGK